MQSKNLSKFTIFIEIILIAIGAVYFCFTMLDLDPRLFPAGGEYILLTQTHYVWELAAKCGTCALWNGLINGGAPAFAEMHNAPLHPFVAIPTLFLGVINGSKITLLLSIFTAGFGQWKLSKSLGLGRITRLWTAVLMMFGGQLAGKMASGNIGLVLSTACTVLFFAELYEFTFLQHNKTSAIRLAISFSLSILAGQGYLQLAALVVCIPLAFFFAYKKQGKRTLLQFAEPFLLAFLFCGVYFIPLLHFSPNMVKEADLDLRNLQELGYSVLSLVIKDPNYFLAQVLGQDGRLDIYYIYIGWIPVLFAMYGAYSFLHNPKRRAETLWLLLCGIGVYLLSSRELLLFASKYIDGIFKMRSATAITGLATAPLIALAGMGFETLFNHPSGSISWKRSDNSSIFQISPILVLCLALAFFSARDLFVANRGFLYLVKFEDPDADIQSQLILDEAQWVQPFTGAIYPYLFHNNAKVSWCSRPWHWKDNPEPLPYVRAEFHPEQPDPAANTHLGAIDYYIDPNAVYAGIYATQNLAAACTAQSLGGGRIDVACPDVQSSGTLVVRENYFSGWKAWMDGKRVPLNHSMDHLTIDTIAPGTHTFQFRYQPWDVWLGVAMVLLGCLYSLARLGVLPIRSLVILQRLDKDSEE